MLKRLGSNLHRGKQEMTKKHMGMFGWSIGLIAAGLLWLPAQVLAGTSCAYNCSGVPSYSACNCGRMADGRNYVCGEAPDHDSDGVHDSMDYCPNTPRGYAIRVDARGCMMDSDRDNVPDVMDLCPHTEYGVRTNARGCDLDIDGDGIPYYRDRCQDTLPGVKVNRFGCSAEFVLNDVLFHTGRSTLTRHAKRRLDKIARSLREMPGLESIHVIGFADSRGSERYNDALSERRAHSVAGYLRSRGVNVPMDVGGMGEHFPIASNSTAAGRRYNRRVEITLGRVAH